MKSECCPICSHTPSIDLKAYTELALDDAPKTYTVLRCNECGLRWMSPYPTPNDYQMIYDSNYYESEQEGGFFYRKEKQELAICYTKIAQHFRSLNITNRLLDIGCGTGDFLTIAKDNNVFGEGVEPSEYAAQKAIEAGFSVFQGTLSDFLPRSKMYAAAHCSHVLEHVPDAHALMEQIKNILEPGAPVYIEVPIQFDGLLDIINRLRHRHRSYSDYSIHHHYFFTPQSMRLLLEKHGFEVLSLTTFLPCRRTSRKPGFRKWALQSSLWAADFFDQRGDVISVWARREK